MAEEAKNWVRRTRDYIEELRQEMRRVSWPNRRQVEGTTAVVIVSVFLFAGYFAIVDSILQKATNSLFTFFTK